MYLSYFGIRVMDMARSLKFYTELFGLTQVAKGDNSEYGGGNYVLLRDKRSGQKLELNWYPRGSPYDVPYAAGEGLDHIAFKVEDVDETLRALAAQDVEVMAIAPSLAQPPGAGFRVAYVKDPDGNWIELYQHFKPLGPSIPEGY